MQTFEKFGRILHWWRKINCVISANKSIIYMQDRDNGLLIELLYVIHRISPLKPITSDDL